MVNASGLLVPAFAALAAACAFGVAAALQHQQARQAPRSRTLSWRLLADVVRRPLWLAGLGLATGAYGLQAVALAYGPLTLVAPIVAADLLFALPLAARWSRRPLRPRDWGGCLLVAAGVAVFLAVSPPPVGRHDVPAADWFLVFGTVAAITLLAVTAGRVTGSRARAGLLAGAAGVIFGLTAAVTASLTRSLREEGIGSLLSHWQPWALIWLGITGILLSTGAFQASALSSSLPIIDTVEPVSGVIIGAVLFNERLASSPSGIAIQLAAAVVAAAGITMLGPSLALVQSGKSVGDNRRRPSTPPDGRAEPAGHPEPVPAAEPARPASPVQMARTTRPPQPFRPPRALARRQVPRQSGGCDLLEPSGKATTTEGRADQLRP